MNKQTKKPLISVITATYNRSNVLFYTISSLLRSSFPDWELIVIGDACTDDTEEVVLSFKDPRIRFDNLQKNYGDQAGPNNQGFRLAQGQYIAYLNHDDLWMPEHLNIALNGIKETGADMVFTMGIAMRRDGENHLLGAIPEENFIPNFIPASLWLMKRELLEEIGPWRHPLECYVQPSQDLLIRAWKAGKIIRPIPEITVIAIHSGHRPFVYILREFQENKNYFERMQRDQNFLIDELSAIARSQALASGKMQAWSYFRKGFKNLVKIMALKIGIVPYELALRLRYRKKGGFINQWRKTIGLSKLK